MPFLIKLIKRSNNNEAPGAAETQAAAAQSLGSGPVLVLIVTLLVQAMAVAAVLAPTVIAPEIARALGLRDSAVGIYISLIYISAICSALYSGTLISKWGAIRVSQGGLVLCGVGLGLSTTGVVALGLAGAVIAGLGYGPITPASSHILIRTTPRHRLSIVFSIKQTGVPVGGIVAGLLIPPQQIAFGWVWALLSVSIGCVVMATIAQLVRSELDTDRGHRIKQSLIVSLLRPVRLVMSHRQLRVLAACSFAFAGVQLSLTTYLSSYLHLSLGWSLLAAGVALSVTQAAGMVGRIVWGAIADAGFGAHRTLVLLNTLMIASCIGTAMFGSGMPRFLIFTILAVFGASAVGWNGVFLGHVARLAPEGKASLVTGGALAFTFFGTVFWAPLFGLLADATASYQVAFLAFCLPLLACLGFLMKGRVS
jgi:MFS family permease